MSPGGPESQAGCALAPRAMFALTWLLLPHTGPPPPALAEAWGDVYLRRIRRLRAKEQEELILTEPPLPDGLEEFAFATGDEHLPAHLAVLWDLVRGLRALPGPPLPGPLPGPRHLGAHTPQLCHLGTASAGAAGSDAPGAALGSGRGGAATAPAAAGAGGGDGGLYRLLAASRAHRADAFPHRPSVVTWLLPACQSPGRPGPGWPADDSDNQDTHGSNRDRQPGPSWLGGGGEDSDGGGGASGGGGGGGRAVLGRGVKLAAAEVFGCFDAVGPMVELVLGCEAAALRRLDLEGCSGLTDRALAAACRRLPLVEARPAPSSTIPPL